VQKQPKLSRTTKFVRYSRNAALFALQPYETGVASCPLATILEKMQLLFKPKNLFSDPFVSIKVVGSKESELWFIL
jgi:hypothetical protein